MIIVIICEQQKRWRSTKKRVCAILKRSVAILANIFVEILISRWLGIEEDFMCAIIMIHLNIMARFIAQKTHYRIKKFANIMKEEKIAKYFPYNKIVVLINIGDSCE